MAVNGALVADRLVAVDVCQALLYVAVPSVVKEAVLRVGAGLSDADTVADDPLDEMDAGLSDAETIPGNPIGESWSSLAS